VLFSQYVQAVQLGLPIDRQRGLECACRHVLDATTSSAAQQTPTAVESAAGAAAWAPGLALDAMYLNASVTDSRGQLVPDGSPVAALRSSNELEAMSTVLRVIKQSVAALQWLQSEEGRQIFSSLFDGSMA
jgi:hypothetical protein